MNHEAGTIFIGDHHLDYDRSTLTGPVGTFVLSSREVDVIRCLAARVGETVSRREIIDAVWTDDPIGNRELSRSVSELRSYFGDSCHIQKHIETVRGCGYRLVAPVTVPDDSNSLPNNDCELQTKTTTSQFWCFMIELRERKVCRAALLYAVSVWLILQIADVIFSALFFPEWALSFVIVTGILGFPIAIILAWTFEVTPEGLVLDIPASNTGYHETNNRDVRWNVVLLCASGLISMQMLWAGFGAIPFENDRLERLEHAESIVVIPFRATSVSLETKAYAFALSEQLRHLLSTDIGMEVIAADALPNRTDIHRRADVILDGSIALTADSAHVMVHLIDPSDGHDLWSEVVQLTETRLGNSQSQLAMQIVEVLPIGGNVAEKPREPVLAAARRKNDDSPIAPVNSHKR